MKRLNWIFAALFFSMAAPAFAGVTGNVNLFLGEKNLDSDWGIYDDQGEFGILFDISGDYWPVSIAVDLLGSAHTEEYWWGDATASTGELDLGVRKVFDIPGTSFHPYVGGGLAFVSARYEETDYYGTIYTEDDGTGIWLNGGIYWTLGRSFNLGLDLRHSQADVTLDGVEVDAGGTHGGILLGYHW